MNNFELSVDVSIRNYNGPGGNLQLHENMVVGEVNFSEMAGLLEGFHQLIQSIKRIRDTREQKSL